VTDSHMSHRGYLSDSAHDQPMATGTSISTTAGVRSRLSIIDRIGIIHAETLDEEGDH
jgi:hypothetical protein